MPKFHTLKVSDIVRETADTVSLAFDIPSSLKQQYQYKQGQYLTLKFIINGEELRRSYSICSSPVEEHELRVAIKKVKDGKISTFINDTIKIGDSIEVMIPMGNFYTEMNAAHKINYVLFAGGSGITPILSILKTVLVSEPLSSITLFYGNNDEASIIFKKHLDKLASTYSDRLKVYHILNNAPLVYPELLKGMLSEEKCVELLKSFVTISMDHEFFICGPTPMMDNAVAALIELHAPESKIHVEYFSAPKVNEPVPAITENSTGAKALIIKDGDEYNVDLLPNETILQAALRIGMDAPYACQGGSCCTCRALLEEGEVKMTVNYALSAAEVEKGYILTCQSRATTPNVVVNYDRGM